MALSIWRGWSDGCRRRTDWEANEFKMGNYAGPSCTSSIITAAAVVNFFVYQFDTERESAGSVAAQENLLLPRFAKAPW